MVHAQEYTDTHRDIYTQTHTDIPIHINTDTRETYTHRRMHTDTAGYSHESSL